MITGINTELCLTEQENTTLSATFLTALLDKPLAPSNVSIPQEDGRITREQSLQIGLVLTRQIYISKLNHSVKLCSVVKARRVFLCNTVRKCLDLPSPISNSSREFCCV